MPSNPRDIKGKKCACGNVAVKFKNNDYICERCDKIEEKNKAREICRNQYTK